MPDRATLSPGVVEEKAASNRDASIPASGTPLALSESNPPLVWEALTAHQRCAALKAGVDLGVFNAAVALIIATTKALLVALFFMHLKGASEKLLKLVVISTVFFLFILLVLSMADYGTRALA